MAKSTTLSAQFLCYSLPTYTKIICPSISVRVKKTEIYNQYELYSITYAYVSSVIEVVDFNFSYSPVSIIISLFIVIAITFVECLNIFVLDISNAFENTILPNPEERVYISLPHIYLEFFTRKWPKHPLVPINSKYLSIQNIK